MRRISLALILPGLAGLIVSAMISVHYRHHAPLARSAATPHHPPQYPRNRGVPDPSAEDRKLDLFEYSSIGVFLPGLILGLVYLEKWAARQPRTLAEDEFLVGDYR